MNGAPLLAALLRAALPGLATLDLHALARPGGLFPFLTARVGAPRKVDLAEHALLAAFRDPAGAPLVGFHPARDAALRAGAAAAWGGADTPRLVVLTAAEDPAQWLAAGAMVLTDQPPAAPGAAILLLIGRRAAPRHLLLPTAAVDGLLPALAEAAEAIARQAGTRAGIRRISDCFATLTLAAEAPAEARIDGTTLPRIVGRTTARLLLGCLSPGPWRLTIGAPCAAVFLDGCRAPITPGNGGPSVLLHPGPHATILGLVGTDAPPRPGSITLART